MPFVEYTEPQKVKVKGRTKECAITCTRTSSTARGIRPNGTLKAKLGDRCRIFVDADKKVFALTPTKTGGYPVNKSGIPIVKHFLESAGVDVSANWNVVGITNEEGGVAFRYGNLPKVAEK